MTGPELKAARERLGLGVVAFARRLGLRGTDDTVSRHVRRLEAGERDVRPWMERACVDLLAENAKKGERR